MAEGLDAPIPPRPPRAPDARGRTAFTVLLRRILSLHCLVCGQGRIFSGWFRSVPKCRVCGYIFRRRESGYFLMAAAISYFVTVFVTFSAWLVLSYVFKLESAHVILGLTLVVSSFFPLWFFRYSRMIWMAVDLTLDPVVKEDFAPP